MNQLLIVCPSEFCAVCEYYADFKRKSGISCVVRPFSPTVGIGVPFLQTMQALGIDPDQLHEPAALLKVCLVNFYFQQRTRYVLLAGDSDRLPVPWFEFIQGSNRYFYPTDLYYADLFKKRPQGTGYDSWDPDRDGVKGEFRASEVSAIDFQPDIAVGRIPASSVAELENTFARLMSRPARAPRFLILHGNDDQSNVWLEQVSGEAANLLRQRGYGVNTLSIPPGASTTAAQSSLDQLHALLQAGVEYIFWFGHGGTGGWGSFGPYELAFAQEVPNISGSPVVFSVSCEVGAYCRGVYGNPYFSGGVLTTSIPMGSSQVPAVPDSLQPAPSGVEADFAPEQWLVKQVKGATALIAGHSWGSLNSDYLKVQPLDFIKFLRNPNPEAPPPFIGAAYKSMLCSYLARYKSSLATDGGALNHLLRIHLFGDPTTPLFC